MKLYYKYSKYNCSLKSEPKNILWNNAIKLTISMPLSDYLKMSSDINDCGKEFHFRLLIDKHDKHDVDFITSDGLWVFDSKLIIGNINSKYPDGSVEIILRLSIESMNECSTKEKRELIVNDIFKNEKGE